MPDSSLGLACVLGGRLYVTGGRTPNTAVMEAYDPATDTWSRRASMPTARSGHGGEVVRGCLYAMGGEGNGASGAGTFPQNEVYDPGLDRWQAQPAMPTARHGIAAVAFNNRIFVPGGADVQGFGATAIHEVFTPAADMSCP